MDKKRIVVTGINGFVGHHLARELTNQGVSVIGIGTDSAIAPELAAVVDEYHAQDLTQGWPELPDVDGVIHLAGLAAVGPSFDSPQLYITANSAMVTNLCEYYVKQEKRPRIMLVSSGAIYKSDQPLPIDESGIVAFSSPYAVSKVLNEHQADYYRNRGLDCIVVRPFNHIGPGQAKGFILPDFYDRIQNATEDTIKVGNIDTKRDYTDVRDVVKAYTLLILAPELQQTFYNVCSGRSLSGREILDKLKTALGRQNLAFEIDRALVRPTDIAEIVGSAARLRDELWWQPNISIDQTIADFVGAQE